ncbi:UDP-N-acetylmuramate--L-alanine ligase, partial [bacterium]
MAEISALPEEQSLGKIQGFSGRHIHFIGIGGIGMSGIASLLSAQGYFVSGSDIKESPQTRKLSEKGIRIFLGHESANLDGAQMVVYSSAIKNENPELAAARESGLAVMHRAEVLAKMMRDKTTIAVSGSHGKTTTTALIGHLLLEAGFHPTLAAGGVLRNVDDNACLGKSDFFVAEADESDGTFLYYSPDYPIVTN